MRAGYRWLLPSAALRPSSRLRFIVDMLEWKPKFMRLTSPAAFDSKVAKHRIAVAVPRMGFVDQSDCTFLLIG
jgi:hypothetical protein